MDAYSFDSNYLSGSNFFNVFDPFSRSLGGVNGTSLGGPASLVLDSEKEELVKAPAKGGKKGASEAKALAALKSHSEAERRRRERINAHLATLRGLVPCNEKMDKATLLAEVISQVKELKNTAMEASKGFLIPMNTDEVRVEPYDDGAEDGILSFKASLCCEYRPELLSDLRQALDALNLRMVKAEIATLEGRVKNVFVFSGCKQGNGDNTESRQVLASAVRQALSSVLDKAPASPEYSPRTTLPNKRQRISLYESSSTSS